MRCVNVLLTNLPTACVCLSAATARSMSSPDTGYVPSPSTDSDYTTTDQYSPNSTSNDYFRRSGKDVWRASLALHRRSHRKDHKDTSRDKDCLRATDQKDLSRDTDSGIHSDRRSSVTVEKSRVRRRRPATHCNHEQQHLHNNNDNNNNASHNNSFDTHQPSKNQHQQDGTIHMVERRGTVVERRDASKPTELASGQTHNLVRSGLRTEAQQCVDKLRQPLNPNLSTQMSASSSQQLSLNDLSQLSGHQAQVNRAGPSQTLETLSKQSAGISEVTYNSRDGNASCCGSEMTEDAAHVTQINVTEDDDGPTPESCRQRSQLADVRDAATRSNSEQPTPCNPCSSQVVDGGSGQDKDDRKCSVGDGVSDVLGRSSQRSDVADKQQRTCQTSGKPAEERRYAKSEAKETCRIA